MTTPGEIRAGRGFVELFLKTQKLDRGLRRVQNDLKNFSAKVATAARGAAVAAASLAIPIVASIGTYSDFAGKIAEVGAVSRASADDVALLRKTAEELGATTQFSASQVAEAEKLLAQSGQSARQIAGNVGTVLAVAQANSKELAETTDAILAVGGAYELAGDQIGRVGDVMTAAATSSNQDILLLGSAFEYVGPVAVQAGQGLEEVAAATVLLAKANIRGEKAGTALRSLIATLASDTEVLGVATRDADGGMRPLLDVFRELEGVLGRLPQGEATAKLFETFGLKAAPAAGALLKFSGSIAEARREMAAAEGIAARISATMDATLRGSLRAAVSAVEALEIAIGTQLESAVDAVVDTFSAATRGVAAFVVENRAVVLAVAGVAAGLAVAAGGLFTLAAGAKLAAFTIAGVETAVTAARVVVDLLRGSSAATSVALNAEAIAAGAAAAASASLASAMAAENRQRVLRLGLMRAEAAAGPVRGFLETSAFARPEKKVARLTGPASSIVKPGDGFDGNSRRLSGMVVELTTAGAATSRLASLWSKVAAGVRLAVTAVGSFASANPIVAAVAAVVGVVAAGFALARREVFRFAGGMEAVTAIGDALASTGGKIARAFRGVWSRIGSQVMRVGAAVGQLLEYVLDFLAVGLAQQLKLVAAALVPIVTLVGMAADGLAALAGVDLSEKAAAVSAVAEGTATAAAATETLAAVSADAAAETADPLAGDDAESGRQAVADRIAELERERDVATGAISEIDARIAAIPGIEFATDEQLERLRRAEEQLSAIERYNADRRLGEQIAEQFRTPAERLEDRMEDLNRLNRSGLLSDEKYLAAARAAKDAYDRATTVELPDLADVSFGTSNTFAAALGPVADGWGQVAEEQKKTRDEIKKSGRRVETAVRKNRTTYGP